MKGCRTPIHLILVCLVFSAISWAQEPASNSKADDNKANVMADSAFKDMIEAKIKAEWEAIKNKDKKAYGDLLADDYQGVEVDGKGERNKIQAQNELPDSNVANYGLWGYKLIPLNPNAAFAIYEVTIQFPPRSVVRLSRVYIGELWVKRADKWQILHYQETHVK